MTDKKYDHVVVGSGVSGMTAALLLGQQGRSVLLLEKAPAIGGSMARFSFQGVPFDTGFHFTGGFEQGGLMLDMLQVLGISDQIEPLHFPGNVSNRFLFEQSGDWHAFPTSRKRLLESLKTDFPEEADAIDRYFVRIDGVCDRTVNMNLRQVGVSPQPLDDDYVSLQTVLDDLTNNAKLKALLAAYCMCYGVKPDTVSFANHARMTQGMFNELVRVRNGGDAFVSAFKNAMTEVGVEIRCGRHVVACEDIQNNMVGRFRLDNGDAVEFDSCLFTIHPKEILATLPADYLRNAFVNRVSSFESSVGFFSVFAVIDDPDLMDDQMVTLLPEEDLNGMFEPGARDEDCALFFASGMEDVDGKPCRTLTAFEAACPEDFEEWADSSIGRRPEAYQDYKTAKTRRICARIESRFPDIAGHLKVLTSSTVLTYRDYLHSPDGSAYGVKQKMGQFNLFGKLPLRNLYVAGQSAVLPGVLGAMMSSFIAARAFVEPDVFNQFINERLGE